MYTLKSVARRGSMLGAAFAIVASLLVPAASVFADSLNPLTERSLLLSSSAPGFQNTDGSGNSADAPNAIGGTYAPPGSGPNGQKTGQTFTFRVSTDSVETNRDIKGITLQYCTSAAGRCQAPGNNTGNANDKDRADTAFPGYDVNDASTWDSRTPDRGNDTASTSDLNANLAGAIDGTDFKVFMDLNDDGDFADLGENVSDDWGIAVSNVEDKEHSGALTGKNNFITLTHATGISPVFNQKIQIVFEASETHYITNPGDDSFFVKINTYDTDDDSLHIPTVPAISNPNIIDGGVTVANVMTDSIHITTKVLETMSFSVGTRNRDTVALNCGATFALPSNDPARIAAIAAGCEANTGATHGTCSPVQNVNGNRLQLGNPDAEYSLETDTAYDVYSYWRLSSNSSGGATVYYSGNTLANTVGDEIAEIGAAAEVSTTGTEQFGLAFVDAGSDTFDAAFSNGSTGLVDTEPERYKIPTLLLSNNGTPGDTNDDIYLAPEAAYANGTGAINGLTPDALFAFEKASNEVPRLIAQNNEMVISCATAKMRYVANIGADTPAGVYTTKINYLAAPQY